MRTLNINIPLSYDFSRASGALLFRRACSEKRVFNFYYEGMIQNRPVNIHYPKNPERPSIHFARVDFTDPEFLYAVEGHLMGACKEILERAPEKKIETAIRQMFGRDSLSLIERGYLPKHQTPFIRYGAKPMKPDNQNYNADSLGQLISFQDYRIGEPS